MNNNDKNNFDSLRDSEEINKSQENQCGCSQPPKAHSPIEAEELKGFSSQNKYEQPESCNTTTPITRLEVEYQTESTYNSQDNNRPDNLKINIPNSTAVLVLGISSIIACCCCSGLISPILAIIALVLYNNSKNNLAQNPDMYNEKSLKNLNAGKICAIIGLVIGVICIAWLVIGLFNGDMDELRRAFEEIERKRY